MRLIEEPPGGVKSEERCLSRVDALEQRRPPRLRGDGDLPAPMIDGAGRKLSAT